MSSRYLIRFGYDTLVRYVNRRYAAFYADTRGKLPYAAHLDPKLPSTNTSDTPVVLQKGRVTRAYRLLHRARDSR
jgi:hypothetical protein